MSTPQQNSLVVIDKFLSAREQTMRETMPATMKVKPERVRKIVVAACASTPKLIQCDPETIWAAVHKSLQLGLEPCSPLGHAYIIPRKNKHTGKMEAHFQLGYRGLNLLAYRTGLVKSISASVVRAGDKFRAVEGLHEDLIHEPDMNGSGAMTHVYCVLRLNNGGAFFKWMTKAQVDAIRTRSQSGDNGPWVTDYEAMALKTVTLRNVRWTPLDAALDDAVAEEEDDYRVEDVTPPRGKQNDAPALPPPMPTQSFASPGAAQEFAAIQQDEAPVVATVTVPPDAPTVAVKVESTPEADLLRERIEGMESPDDYKDIADDLKAAKARTTNPMPKETYDNLASALVAKRDALKKAGAK